MQRKTMMIGILIAAILFSVFPAYAQEATPTAPTSDEPAPQPTPVEYIVRSGDSLSGIARRFGTTTRALAVLNGIVNTNSIFIGQRLLIPPQGVSAEDLLIDPPRTYTVGYGDTLYQIAVRFDTTVAELVRLNDLRNPTVIFSGQVLTLPGGEDAAITEPTPAPVAEPTSEPTAEPVVEPTPVPTAEPTVEPVTEPTLEPTVESQEVQPTVESVAPDVTPSVAFAYGVFTFLPNSNVDQYVEKVEGLGVQWVRLNANWADIEAAQGEPNFNQLDATVDALSLNGFNILLTIATSPTWARSETVEDGPPDDFATFGAFVSQLATRYQGRVQAYQIWNEPNLRREWSSMTHRIGAQSYVDLLTVAYQAIKAADPQARVITAGLSPTGFNDGVNAIDDRQFMRDLYAFSVVTVSDAVAANPGGWANPPESTCCEPAEGVESHADSRTFYFLDTLTDYNAIMTANGDVRPLWVTSFGWGTVEGGDLPQPNESYKFILYNDLNEQAAYNARAFEIGRSAGYVGPMFLNNLNGCISDARRVENCYYSLIGPDGQDRPAYRAVSLLPK
jgi:polysaccharide biosynthesis protein PslG